MKEGYVYTVDYTSELTDPNTPYTVTIGYSDSHGACIFITVENSIGKIILNIVFNDFEDIFYASKGFATYGEYEEYQTKRGGIVSKKNPGFLTLSDEKHIQELINLIPKELGDALLKALLHNPASIELTEVKVKTDPEVKVFQIKMEDESGIWMETPKTSAEVNMFFRGLRAMSHMLGFLEPKLPPLPKDEIF